jgi:hypothetical protein
MPPRSDLTPSDENPDTGIGSSVSKQNAVEGPLTGAPGKAGAALWQAAHGLAKRFINQRCLQCGKAPEQSMRVKAIRLSIGIEHRDAIIADIGQALAGAGNQILRAAE